MPASAASVLCERLAHPWDPLYFKVSFVQAEHEGLEMSFYDTGARCWPDTDTKEMRRADGGGSVGANTALIRKRNAAGSSASSPLGGSRT